MAEGKSMMNLAAGALWSHVPLVVRSILAGLLLAIIGTAPWALLIAANLRYWTSVPWAVPPTALYLWFYWKYLRGKSWPASTREARQGHCRANPLEDEVWGVAIGAGLLGLWAVLLFQSVYGRMVALPVQPIEELAHVPKFTLVVSLVMSALVAGIAEETSFRGYMQGPLEKRFGPTIAILITGALFGFLHFTHREVTIVLMPFYMSVAAVYGALAYITNSILPGMVLHAGGNLLWAVMLLAGGRSEWQSSTDPEPLIWESGTDISFWISLVAFFAVTAAAIGTYRMLAYVVKRPSPE